MVIQGSNNVELRVYLAEKGKPIPLEGSVVSLVLKTGTRKITKSTSIVGNGIVSTLLTSDDIATSGDYYLQAVVVYTDGRTFRSDTGKFPIGAAL